MRSRFTKTFMLLAVISVGLPAADNSIGSWKRNEAKSHTKTSMTNSITSFTWKIEVLDGGAKLTPSGTFKDGTSFKNEFILKYDGKEYPVTGGPWDRMAIKQIDANTFEWQTRSTTGKWRSKAHVRISPDGKTMTMNTTGTDFEGQPFTSVNVFERQ